MSPGAGRDLNIEHPPGTLLGLDALATGACGWYRLHGPKPPSNDGCGTVEREDLHQAARDEPDKPGQRWCDSRFTCCCSLQAPNNLHHGGRRNCDRQAGIGAFEQIPLQWPARVEPGDERRIPGGRQGSRQPASIPSRNSSGEGNASTLPESNSFNSRSTLGGQRQELLTTLAGGGSLLSKAYDRIVSRRAQLLRQSIRCIEHRMRDGESGSVPCPAGCPSTSLHIAHHSASSDGAPDQAQMRTRLAQLSDDHVSLEAKPSRRSPQ